MTVTIPITEFKLGREVTFGNGSRAVIVRRDGDYITSLLTYAVAPNEKVGDDITLISVEEGDSITISGVYELSDDWPSNGVDFNRWYCNHRVFVKALELSGFVWYRNGDFKYINYRVDTRNDRFLVGNGDNRQRVSPLEILNPKV